MGTDRQQQGERVDPDENVPASPGGAESIGADTTMENLLVRTLLASLNRGKEFALLIIVIYFLFELREDVGRLQENVDQVNEDFAHFENRLDSVDKTITEIKTVLGLKLGYEVKE